MSGRESVEMYAKGGHRPIRYYTGAACAFDVVAGDDGTVYVADACDGDRVLIYPPGKTKPTRYVTPGGPPYCLTLDAHNNLYVGYNSVGNYGGQVRRYKPGAKEGSTLIPSDSLHWITGIAVDKNGALLAATESGGTIDVFTRVGKPPSRVIRTGQAHPFRLAFDRNEDTLFVSDVCFPTSDKPPSSSGCSGEPRPNTVVAVDYATGKRLWTIKRGSREPALRPTGVAVYPKAPF